MRGWMEASARIRQSQRPAPALSHRQKGNARKWRRNGNEHDGLLSPAPLRARATRQREPARRRVSWSLRECGSGMQAMSRPPSLGPGSSPGTVYRLAVPGLDPEPSELAGTPPARLTLTLAGTRIQDAGRVLAAARCAGRSTGDKRPPCSLRFATFRALPFCRWACSGAGRWHCPMRAPPYRQRAPFGP